MKKWFNHYFFFEMLIKPALKHGMAANGIGFADIFVAVERKKYNKPTLRAIYFLKVI